MEVAVIDWKSIDTRFVRDELYENINAPKWIDFSSLEDDPVNDEAWFCRPTCNHPKTVDDFVREKQRKSPFSNSKLQRSASVSDIPPLGDRNKRDATLKKRGLNQPPAVLSNNTTTSAIEDGENRDPNFSTPVSYKVKAWKDAIKSSAERKHNDSSTMRKEHMPKLKSTQSARNLFSGGDLLNKVAEFCTELKKLATGARVKDQAENMNRKVEGQLGRKINNNGGYLDDNDKERTPLLDLNKGKSEVMETSGSKGKLRRNKRNDDTENTPVSHNVLKTTPVSVDVKKSKRLETESLLQIRTCPPTPQGFSASGGPQKATPPKAFKSRPLQERGILQELNKHQDGGANKAVEMSGGEVAEKEAARTLDVFWFLKPCTLSS